MPKTANLAANESITTAFFKDSFSEFQRYESDRDSNGIDTKCKVADGMYKCMRNRDLADSEMEAYSGLDSDDETPRANVGSVRFLRMVNQKSAFGYKVISSVEIPWKRTPIVNKEIYLSAEEATAQTAVQNVLDLYTWKRDGCLEKMVYFWNQIYKYTTVPVIINWKKETRRVKVKDPKTQKTAWKDVEMFHYPSWRVLNWSMVYGDVYAPPDKQQTIFILTIVSWKDIQDGVKSGWYDEEQVKKIAEDKAKYRWDGDTGSKHRTEQAENDDNDNYTPGESDLYLLWDVFRWCPIEKDEDKSKKGKETEYTWNEQAEEYKLYWNSSIGNKLTALAAVSVRMKTDIDPDGEIPVRFIKSLPDDNDMLYGLMHSEVVRPQYSIECTLWNQAIDNTHGIVHPPTIVDANKFQVVPDDFRFAPGKVYQTRDIDKAVKDMPVRSVLGEITGLIKLMQEEQSVAANSNKNMQGEANMGRTPASEGIAINRWTEMPNEYEIRFVLYQLLPWLAHKYSSYWQGYGDPSMIKAIADDALPTPVPAIAEGGGIIYGDFDTDLTILDEVISDMVQAQQEIGLLTQLGSNPATVKSDTHKLDLGYWIRDLLRRLGVRHADRIVRPGGEADAHLRQREELRTMAVSLDPAEINEGEDHDAHIMVCEAEELRFAGIVNPNPEVVKEFTGEEKKVVDDARDYIAAVITHRQMHEQALGQKEQQLAAQQASAAEQAQGPRTPGQQAGEPIQAVLGPVGAAGGG